MSYSSQKQNDRYIRIRNGGIRTTLLATVGIIVVFVFYGYMVSHLNEDAMSFNINKTSSSLGLTIILFLFGSLITIGYGIYRICLSQKMKVHSIPADGNVTMILPVIVNIISQTKRYRFIFFIVLTVYGLLFAFVSQIVIFRPGISFSNIYKITIPSWAVSLCCNLPGLVPTFTAYLSDNLIIFIIPINLIIAIILSTLVSVNITLTLYMFQNSRSKKAANNSCFSGIGVAMGLFTACPTCAGTFFSTITGVITAGTSSALAAGVASDIAPFQVVLIMMSISVLLVSPYLMIRGLKNYSRCSNRV